MELIWAFLCTLLIKKDIPVERPIQGLNDTTLTAESKYVISFTQPNKRFALSLH